MARVTKDSMFTYDELSKTFAYDPETGRISWLIATRNSKVGDEAGGVSVVRKVAGGAYRYVGYRGTHIQGARLAWLLGHGEWPLQQVGVKDGNALNLALENLQLRNTVKGAFSSKAEYHAAHVRENPAAKKAWDIRKAFDLSLGEYSAMVAIQGNRCAICGQEETATRHGKQLALHVDHDHETGLVRQLLCAACNMGIGQMRDDPQRLRAAADYIERHRARKKECA